jgi:hypothetical protein
MHAVLFMLIHTVLFTAHSTTLTAAPGQSQVESSSRAQLVQQIGCVNKLYKHLNGMITMETMEYGRARRIPDQGESPWERDTDTSRGAARFHYYI